MSQLFYEHLDNTIKRGDIFSKDPSHIRYRNDNVYIYTGKYFIPLIDTIDEYGSVPSQFTTEEFPPSYWTNTIAHNNLIWFTPNKYKYTTKPLQITNDIFCINDPQNKYPLYFAYNEEYKTPIYKYILEILPKITIPISCDNGETLIQCFDIELPTIDLIVIIDNVFTTSYNQTFTIKSIKDIIKYSYKNNWRDLLVQHICDINKTPKKGFFDFCFSSNSTKSTIHNINVKLFDKNLFI
jgi:hypothetical protein